MKSREERWKRIEKEKRSKVEMEWSGVEWSGVEWSGVEWEWCSGVK